MATALRDAVPALEVLAKAQRAAEKADVASDGPTASPALEPTTSEAPPRLLAVALEKRIPLLKTGEERYVLGIVLEPETVDAQDDIYSAAEIREAAHRFMEEYRNIGLMHRGLVNGRVKILESYLAPTSFALEGAQVRKGTWLLAMRVLDDDLWSQVKSGELTGLSMGGSAARLQSLPRGAQAPAHDLHREREAEVAGGGWLGDRVTADPGDPTCWHGTRGGNES